MRLSRRGLVLSLGATLALSLGAATLPQAAHSVTNGPQTAGPQGAPDKTVHHPRPPAAPPALSAAPALQHEPPVDLTPAAQVTATSYPTANPSDAALLVAGSAQTPGPTATPPVRTTGP